MKVNMRPIAVGLTFPLQTSGAWLQPFLSIREHFRIRCRVGQQLSPPLQPARLRSTRCRPITSFVPKRIS